MATKIEQKMLTNRELSVFCAQISMLLRSGIAVPEGIRIMLEDIEDAEGERILTSLLDCCELGTPLSDALIQSKVFPKYLMDMVRIGEATGKLEEVMAALERYYDREETVSKNIRSAVRYPVVMIVMMVLVVGVLVVKVLPIFNQVFIQFGTEMTGLGGSILRIGMTLSQYSLWFVGLLAAAALFLLYLSATPQGRALRSRLGMRFFATKKIYERRANASFTSALALMLASGLDTDKSLEMAAQLVDHPVVKARIEDCQKSIAQGTNFASALVEAKLFSGVYGRMISIAFKTGTADSAIQQLADQYSMELENEINDRIFMVEPTLVAVFSVIVGIILLSVMLPLMGIMSTIG